MQVAYREIGSAGHLVRVRDGLMQLLRPCPRTSTVFFLGSTLRFSTYFSKILNFDIPTSPDFPKISIYHITIKILNFDFPTLSIPPT